MALVQPQTQKEYADFWRYEVGVNVIPADGKTKRPKVEWRQYQNLAISEIQHKTWKDNNAFSDGMAIVLGKAWHKEKEGLYLCGIDADNKKAIEELFPEGLKALSQKTLVESHPDNPNKCHVYFYTTMPAQKKSSDITTSAKKINQNQVPAFEVKGLGEHGIMICSPSPHKDGSQYQIMGTRSIATKDDIDKLVENVCKKFDLKHGDKNTKQLVPIQQLYSDEFEIIEGHNRHEGVLRISESLIKNNKTVPLNTIYKWVKDWNQSHCSPPLPETDLQKIWSQAKSFIDSRNDDELYQKLDTAKTINDERGIEQAILDILFNENHFVTLSDTKEILYYHNGVYKVNGEQLIERKTEELYDKVSSHRVNEILGHIRRRTMRERGDLDKNPLIINMKNGLLDVETGQLLPHNPRYLSVNQIPVNFDSSAQCPNTLRFLKTTLSPEYVKTAISLAGLCVSRNTRFQVAFLFTGSGGNGKSVLRELIESLVGYENVSSVTLQDLENDRFAKAQLYGKSVNMAGDIPHYDLSDTSVFKSIVSGDPIEGERKYQSRFKFKPNIILIFSANHIPRTGDDSDGFYRRWIILPFPNSFDGQEDRYLIERITTEEELSGFFNLVLCSIQWMKRTEQIPVSNQKTIEERRESYQRNSDTVSSFLSEMTEINPDKFVIKEVLYQEYCNYCRANGLSKETENGFGRKMKARFQGDRQTIEGQRKYVWIGISLK